MSIQMIPLNLLFLAPENVRKTGGEADETLIALLREHGVLQNLVVRPEVAAKGKGKGKPTGRFAVTAGGRRLDGQQKRAAAGEIPPDFPMPCKVMEGDGTAVSLTENLARRNMAPLDELDAFVALVDGGKTEDEVARQFGVTVLHVKQRLKLSRVSPVIRAAFREGEIILEALKAYTISDDFARQEEVFATGWAGTDPYHIRRQLLERKLSAHSKVVKFVGLDAYEAAGGIVTRDLFGESPDCIEDPGLIERLAREKLKAHADALIADGWAWIEPVDMITWELRRTCVPLKASRPEPSEEDRVEAEELADELDGLDDDDDAERVAAINARLAQLDDKVAVAWSAEQKASAGGWIAIGYDGALTVELGWVRPTPDDGAEEAGAGDGMGFPSGYETRKDEPAAPGHSWALVEDMSAHLTAGLQAELAERPDLAYLLLLHSLVLDVFYPSSPDRSLNIRASMGRAEWHGSTADTSEAAKHIKGRLSQLQNFVLPKASAEVWGYLVQASDERKAEILAVCVASTVVAVQKATERGDFLRSARQRLTSARHIGRALSLDMAKWWRPTSANYLGAVSKDIIIAALAEAGQSKPGENLATMKKAQLAALAEERLGPTTWLPPFLRIEPPTPEGDGATENQVGIEDIEQALAAE